MIHIDESKFTNHYFVCVFLNYTSPYSFISNSTMVEQDVAI